MLSIAGSGQVKCSTGVGFFDHMLTLMGVHGGMDLEVEAAGDLHVDGHHTVEDTGIVLGKALSAALGDKGGITRYGTAILPMDEALCMVCLDISGRPYLHFECPVLTPMVGSFDTELLEEFFRALSVHAGLTLHIRILYGQNSHHMIEAAFKAFGRAFRQAAELTSDINVLPSTKGFMD
jgi:imidazoleglycerol-phosphate dehydratase